MQFKSIGAKSCNTGHRKKDLLLTLDLLCEENISFMAHSEELWRLEGENGAQTITPLLLSVCYPPSSHPWGKHS